MKKNVLIIGYGIVGNNLSEELKSINPDIVDKYKPEVNTIRNIHYDLGFICVDTPLKDNTLDIKEVINSINEYDCEIYCIKSTCPVGTVDKLTEVTNKKIVFCPEYYGNTIHSKSYNFDFTILGGKKDYCNEIIDILLPCYDKNHIYKIVEPKLAELVKFMENSFLATKVSFCTSFYNVCQKENIDYDILRELFLLDPRVNPSHTIVYKDSPYWDSHCLNKDVPSIANQYDIEFLKDIIEINDKQKTAYKK